MSRPDPVAVKNILVSGLFLVALTGGVVAGEVEGREGQSGSPAAATTVKGSKSNTSERRGSPESKRTSNLNLSKSNINRSGSGAEEAGGSSPASQPSDGTVVKSKSNITNN